ncbi:TonB-dependent receptor plug domain-containing protein [Thermodesulfobacteriota bacterium]
MLTASIRIGLSVLFLLLTLLSQATATEQNQEPPPLSEEQKMEQIKGFFESEYQEVDYFRTDRLLLTATKRNIPIRKAPAIATVITQEEIRYMGARNLRDVLTMVPGIGVSKNEFGIYMYEVRGIRTPLSEKILVMIDGHSLNKSIITGSALYRIFQDMPVKDIKQIEVIRGPGSALYGANAFVAVINIITRDAVDISGVELSGSLGNFHTGEINLVGGKIYNNGFQVSGSLDYFMSNGENFLIEEDALHAQGLSFFSSAPGYAFTEIEKTDIFLKASYKDLAFKGHYISHRFDAFYIGFSHVLTDDSSDPVTNFWSEVTYSPKLTDRLQTTFKAYFDFYEQDTLAEIMPEGFLGIFPDGMFAGPKCKNQTIGGEMQVDYDPSNDNHFVVGAMYERTRQYDVKQLANFNPLTGAPLPSGQVEDVSDILNWNIEEDRNVWALYFQDEWSIKENLTFTAGVRHDHYSEFGGTTNPRFGLVWGFIEKADLKLLYGEAFRAPNFAELYNLPNPVVWGNPNLNPETIKTYEVSTTFRLKRHFTVDLNYFHNDIEDLIVWGPPTIASGTTPVYINAGSAEVDGVEVILSGNYTSDDYWKLTYTYQNPEDGNGVSLRDVPKHRATAGINLGLTDYLTIHADVLWTGTRPRFVDDSRLDMGQHTVLNMTLTADNFFKNLEIQLAVYNILGEDYEDPDSSVNDTQPLPYIPNDFPREGRTIWGELRYTF